MADRSGAMKLLRHALPALVGGALIVVLAPFVERARADLAPPAKIVTEPAAACQGDHWVGAWAAAPQDSSLGRSDDVDGPARTFVDQTLRMVLTPSTGGSALRLHLGNRHGVAPVTIDAVTVGVQQSGATLVPGSVRTVAFGGARSLVLSTGTTAVSDPLFVTVEPFEALAVSFHVVGAAVVDQHQWAQSTQYAAPARSGDHADDESGAAFTEELGGWFGVAGVDVLTSRQVGALVTLGDSITDGVGSSPNRSQRWPDVLARRLAASRTPLAIVNAGISGNHVVTSGRTSPTAIGPSAVERLDVDALQVAGATDLFLFEGINDIYKADEATDIAAQIVSGYRDIIDRAHEAGLRVVGATITSAAMSGVKEAARVAVNEWIRTSGAYDAVVDFDAVTRDATDPSRVRPEWDAGYAHLNDAGYAAMAEAIDPAILRGTGC